jgi:hypothetical protein
MGRYQPLNAKQTRKSRDKKARLRKKVKHGIYRKSQTPNPAHHFLKGIETTAQSSSYRNNSKSPCFTNNSKVKHRAF